VRVNGQRIAKPAQELRAGDVLTFPQGARIRVVRVLAPGQRRGPAAEAAGLYADLDAAPGPLE
jgi:ribosome-associated heat shock protein Hsp15